MLRPCHGRHRWGSLDGREVTVVPSSKMCSKLTLWGARETLHREMSHWRPFAIKTPEGGTRENCGLLLATAHCRSLVLEKVVCLGEACSAITPEPGSKHFSSCNVFPVPSNDKLNSCQGKMFKGPKPIFRKQENRWNLEL